MGSEELGYWIKVAQEYRQFMIPESYYDGPLVVQFGFNILMPLRMLMVSVHYGHAGYKMC